MKKIRRIDAIAAGLKTYFTEKPCKAGHVAERYTANGHCTDCQAECAKTEKVKTDRERYRESNKAKQAALYVSWYASNKDAKLSYMREYSKAVATPRTRRRYKTDHVFAMTTRCRARLSKALQRAGFAKNGSTHDLIGCSYEDLVAHIESQFVDGMGWHNRNEWHIDHMIPVASAKTEEELLALFHFSNLRPLWAADNRKKGARLEVAA
jgi:hypothetical protein